MKSVHPFDGQKFDRARSLKFWDDIAYDYEGRRMQGDIPQQITSRLFELGDLRDTAIEFGCGPGTYSVHLAKHVGKLTCIDYSQRMLALLSESCSEEGIDNVDAQSADFMSLSGNKQYNLVLASLCPGAGTKEGLEIMESFASDVCVHIMWIENTWDNVHSKVWKVLGKDYSFEARRTDTVSGILRGMGRKPSVEEFVTDVGWTLPAEDLLEREERVFSVYGLENEDVRGALNEVLGEYISNDIFSIQCTNRIRMIRWIPGGDDAC